MKKYKYIFIGILWPFLTSSIVALFYLPQILHCMDFKEVNVTINNLSGNINLGTSNYNLEGVLSEEGLVSLEKTSLRFRYSEYENFIPVVSENHKAGDSIYCIMKIDRKNLVKLIETQKQLGKVNMKVTCRNLCWESIESDVLDMFRSKNKIAKKIVFIEYGSQSTFPFWLMVCIFLLSIIGSFGIIHSNKGSGV